VKHLRVEVVYALPLTQERVLLDLPPGSTVRDALRASGLPQELLRIEAGRLGVWGRVVTADTRLCDRDRVEIYRPLLADPKEVRRKRAARARK
jgi:putative ubiquitin-RnfH superfamily antitoxin RatB of RatAB toxin-antitoxin module